MLPISLRIILSYSVVRIEPSPHHSSTNLTTDSISSFTSPHDASPPHHSLLLRLTSLRHLSLNSLRPLYLLSLISLYFFSRFLPSPGLLSPSLHILSLPSLHLTSSSPLLVPCMYLCL
ncbi:hypothetical protein Pcinc_005412 [Petrolisthes cinctipes]|uniref:Uncharacterized protein n=1 Tax=Petrolisthes cinctipes TaxID=88211 RepID=A0AAE1GF87_PETCI|nr:hypothetical protein Pcinc_005412 [Petrolisthes cinctipes]